MIWIRKAVYIIIAVAILAVAWFLISTPTGYVAGEAYSWNIKGAHAAKVTIVEYSDFECPFCARAEPTIKQILEKYPDDVQLVYKHFPLPSHSNSWKAAEASECAAEQGKFWEYHDILFENQDALYITMLKDYAKQLGLNTEEFDACLDSGSMKARIENDKQEGESLGVSGTPAFFVNGKMISGAQPFSVFDAAVSRALSSS